MRRLLLALLLILVGLPAGLVGALLTPWGLRQAVGLGAGFVPGLEIAGVEGPLPGRLSVARVALRDADGAWLEAEGVELRLAWRALLSRRVEVEALTITRLALHRLPPGEPAAAPAEPGLALPSLPKLPVEVSLGALRLARVELGEAVLGQPVAASVEGAGAWVSTGVELRLALDRLDAPGALRLAAQAGEDRLALTLTAQEPPGGVVARLAGLPEAALDAHLRLEDGAWTLQAALGAARVSGRGRAALAQGALTLGVAELHAEPGPLLPADVAPLAARVELTGEVTRAADGAIGVTGLALTAPAGRVTGAARLAADGALAGRLGAELAGPALFAGLLPQGLGWDALTAEVELAGTLAAPRLAATARVAAPRTGTPEADALLGDALALRAEFAEGGAAVRVEAEAARAALTVTGRALEPMALDLTARVTDPAPLSGTVSLTGRLTGDYAAPGLEGVLEAPRLEGQGQVVEAARLELRASPVAVQANASGRYQEAPFTLALDLVREGEVVRLRRLDGAWQGAVVEGEGEGSLAAGPQRGRLRLEVPDLAQLPGGLGGRLSLRASAEPGAAGPHLALHLDSPDLRVGGQRARVELALDGTLDALAMRFSGSSGPNAVEMAATLRAPEGPQGATEALFTRLEARAGPERVSLAAPVRVTRSAAGDIVLEAARFAAPRGGRLVVQGALREGRVEGQAELAALPLAPLTGGAVQGTLSGQVRASGPVAAPEARFTLRGEGLAAAAAPGLPPARLTATGETNGQSARVEARLEAGQAVNLTLTARQPRGLGPAAPLEATLRGRADLGALARPVLAGSANRATGVATLDLRATGTPAAPVLAGGAQITGGSFTNAEQGLRLEGITARLTAQGQRLVLERLQANTPGAGPITAQGWVEPLGPNLPAELRLRADGARPVRGPFGEAVLDLDLTLRGPLLADGALSGRVGVRRAELRIPENLAPDIPTLGAVREVGPMPPGRARPPARPPAAPLTGPPLALDVRLEAPRAVFVRGRGLEAELGGDIRVTGRLDAPSVTGAFRLRRGSFDLAGRALNLTRGEARFDTGTLLPSLDMVATSRARSHTITLTITGRVDAPELRVGAVPELPQDEALARLLFDRETSRLSPFEVASLAQAAAQLAGLLPAGGGPADRLRQALGLDRLSAGAEQQGRGATIEAGRYVAPGVYVGVRQGTGGEAPAVGVQVELTPRLRLEAQTQTGPAGDRIGLSYEIEY